MTNRKNAFERLILCATLLLAPTQLAFHFWPDFALVFGIRIDFLAPAVYLTDILIAGLCLNYFVQKRRLVWGVFKKKKWFLFFLLVFVFLNTLNSTFFWVTLIRWIKIFEFVIFGLYIKSQTQIDEKGVLKTLLSSLAFLSVLGIYHFLTGQTFGGVLYFLGERSFGISTPGISLVEIDGRDFLRAYSTFPHPNSLAGFLGGFLTMFFVSKRSEKIKWFLVLPLAVCFLLTFSLSAFLGIVAAVIVWALLSKNIKPQLFKLFLAVVVFLSILLPVITQRLDFVESFGKSASERLVLAEISGKMIAENPFLGTGLNTFILNIPVFAGNQTTTPILQPVHNIFLLVFSETGLLGLLILFFLLNKFTSVIIKKRKYLNYLPFLVFVFVTGMLDHYWLTIQQNTILLSVFFGLSLRNK